MSWKLAALMAMTLTAAPQAAAAATDGKPQAVSLAGACAPEAVPPGALCEVVGTATLGNDVGAPLGWALYEITGAKRSGLSVLLETQPSGAQKVVASLPVAPLRVDIWREAPYVVASVVERDGVRYAVMSVRGDKDPSAFSVHRIDEGGWTPVDSSSLWPVIHEKLTSLTGPGCYPIGSDINWRTFGLRYDMMSDAGTCGTAFLDLGFDQGAMTVTSALAVKPDLRPAPRRRRGRR